MKKVKLVFFLIFLFYVSFNCFAYTYKENLTTGLNLEGYVNGYHEVAIYPITGDSYQGMPFDITASDVKYKSNDVRLGRVVAKWDFASTNPKVTISITAEPMKYDDPSTSTVPELNYYISFKYKYVKYVQYDLEDGSTSYTPTDVSGYITACSKGKDDLPDYCASEVTLENGAGGNAFPIISSSQQDIRFMFMDGEEPSTTDYPDGSYSATVTIKFTSGS